MARVPSIPRLLAYIGIGAAAGFLSGLFGVGGGILIVPALVLLMRMPQKVASGTSLLAIAPLSVGGTVAYATSGHIDWAASLIVAIGAIAGGAIGSSLLERLPSVVITWIFIAVMLFIAVQLLLEEPTRGELRLLTPLDLLILLTIGLVAGVLSGLLGVGGGAIIVPALIIVAGFGDLAAKGSSLVALLPNAVTTSVLNLRRGNADLIAGLTIGVVGAGVAVLGMLVATWIDPRTGSILFAALLVVVAVQLAVRTIGRMRGPQSTS